MPDFDAVLESGFQEATNRENFARKIEGKIKEMDGASALIRARRYGEPVSAEKVRANLTLRLLIEQESPQLVVCFGPYATLVLLTTSLRKKKPVSGSSSGCRC